MLYHYGQCAFFNLFSYFWQASIQFSLFLIDMAGPQWLNRLTAESMCQVPSSGLSSLVHHTEISQGCSNLLFIELTVKHKKYDTTANVAFT